MDIENCNEHRTRMMQSMPRTCKVCGLGPCKFPSGELSSYTATAQLPVRIEGPSVAEQTRHNPKMIVHALATERIDAGDMVRVETDLVTGMTYARKA